jgi:hypothetical protein
LVRYGFGSDAARAQVKLANQYFHESRGGDDE